jgi:carbon-monoxide dehydrogenase large subunit
VDAKKATEPGAPQIHENAPNNIVMEWECSDAAAVEKAFAEAEVVIKQPLVNQRLIPTPMETRGCAAMYLPYTDEYTVWITSQAPHVHRLLMTAFVFGIPETKMRVISPQVGGGFGAKIFLYPEYPLVAALAKKIGRPVKWQETRAENYRATTHGRDHIAKYGASTPTPAWWTPTAAQAGLRQLTWPSERWTWWHRRPAWTRPRCAAATSFGRRSSPMPPPTTSWPA